MIELRNICYDCIMIMIIGARRKIIVGAVERQIQFRNKERLVPRILLQLYMCNWLHFMISQAPRHSLSLSACRVAVVTYNTFCMINNTSATSIFFLRGQRHRAS